MGFIKKIFSSTKYTLIICAAFLIFTLFVQGSFLNFFKMKQYKAKITQEIATVQVISKDLKSKLEKVNDPKFIEKQIKEKFDFVKEGDLVFIFSESKETKH
jgi:cell division protein FtsB